MKNLGIQIREKVYIKMKGEIRSQFFLQIDDQICMQLENQIMNQVWDKKETKIGIRIRSSLIRDNSL